MMRGLTRIGAGQTRSFNPENFDGAASAALFYLDRPAAARSLLPSAGELEISGEPMDALQ
jgi:hypothetical protein